MSGRLMQGGRYRSKEGIIYPFVEEISNVDKNLHLTIPLDSYVKNKYKIIVFNHQPGIGKTYTVINYILNKCRKDDKFSFFYFTDRHEAIEERLKTLDKEAKNKDDNKIIKTFEHWKGFSRHCNDSSIDKLMDFRLPIDFIKDNFPVEKAYEEYLKQFKNIKRVFAPFYYLTDEHFKKANPNIVFLDESISHIETYEWNKDKISKVFEKIGTPPEYIEQIDDKGFFWDEEVRKNIEGLYYKSLIKSIEQRGKLDVYKEFIPNNILNYLRFSKIYDYEIDLYSLPIYYHALDVVGREIPIVILDATFNKNLFSYFIEFYNGEMQKIRPKSFKGFKNLKVKVLKSDVTTYDTVIYRMHPKGAWPKRSFIEMKDTTWPWLLDDLHQLRKIFGDANIGVITHKELSWLFESMNFDVEYYGNLRGTNKLENKLVLIIIGAWIPFPPSWTDDNYQPDRDYIDTLIRKYFLIDIKEDDVIEARLGAPPLVESAFPDIYKPPDSKARIRISIDSKLLTRPGLGDLVRYKNADFVAEFPLISVNTIWFDEIYQAFHRNRGLRYPRIIFSYAWFPEPKMVMLTKQNWIPIFALNYNLRKEFKPMKEVGDRIVTFNDSIRKVISEEVKDRLFEFYRRYEKGGLMQDLMKQIELDVNVDEIQKKFKIHKKGEGRGANTKPITELKNTYKNLKDLIEYKES